MISYAVRVAAYAILWFGGVGLANGLDQVREHPYWFYSPWDRLLYLGSLLALYGGAGILPGILAGALGGWLLRGRPGSGRATEPTVALLAAILALALFRIYSDYSARALSPKGILVNLALLSAAGFLLLMLARYRRSWSGVTRILLLGAGLACVAGLGIGALHGISPPPPSTERPNILLLVIDTLRADRLSCYGNPRPTSPALDRLTREGVLFTDAIAAAPLTQPAVTTLLTGLYPRTAGVVNHPNYLANSYSTLAELLGSAGYRTAFACSHPLLTRACGFGQGWDEYRYIPKPLRLEATLLAQALRRIGLVRFIPGGGADDISDAAIEFVSRRSSRPFFVYAHYIDPHFPYTPPPPFNGLFRTAGGARLLDERLPDGRRRIFDVNASDEAIRETVDLYDGEIAFTDREIGRLLAALDARGLSGNTLVVLTADHGESLGEQGLFFAHTHYLYDSTQRVPLLFRYPTFLPAGRLIDDPVSLVDLAPTLHQIAGIEPPPEMEGEGLFFLLRDGGRADRPVYAENGRTVLNSGEEENPRWHLEGDAGRWNMVRVGDWKLIRIPSPAGPTHELYDLRQDPQEATNLAAHRPDLVEELGRHLELWLGRPAGAATQSPEVDEETVQGLRALGYVK